MTGFGYFIWGGRAEELRNNPVFYSKDFYNFNLVFYVAE